MKKVLKRYIHYQWQLMSDLSDKYSKSYSDFKNIYGYKQHLKIFRRDYDFDSIKN